MIMLSQEIKSSLAQNNTAILESTIECKYLIETYKDRFDLDIRKILRDNKEIGIYRCIETGYRFYYPFDLMGDDHFYSHFGKYDWYYLPWKWEHETCLQFISNEDRVLEVGAAKGGFLEKIKQLKKVSCTGLELNSDAVFQGRENGINLHNETIEKHAEKHSNYYDVVCSFQVLEHISNVREVIEAMISCLKPGGKLIISVPNNESFIKDNPLPSNALNMPPHHLGLWEANSLKNLEKVFSILHIKNIIEPLDDIHMDTYLYTRVYKTLCKKELLVRIFWKLRIHLLIKPLIKRFSKKLIGHSIIAVYTKK